MLQRYLVEHLRHGSYHQVALPFFLKVSSWERVGARQMRKSRGTLLLHASVINS